MVSVPVGLILLAASAQMWSLRISVLRWTTTHTRLKEQWVILLMTLLYL